MVLLKELDIRPIGKNGNRLRWALFLCPTCNREVEKVKSNGVKQKECGCRGPRAGKTHGMSHTRIYQIWEDMKNRCDNMNNKYYHNYGGKGVIYTPKWKKFEGFYDDMGDSYEDTLTIDRITSSGNYTKDNCQWLTKAENSGKANRGRKQSDEWIKKRTESRIANKTKGD